MRLRPLALGYVVVYSNTNEFIYIYLVKYSTCLLSNIEEKIIRPVWTIFLSQIFVFSSNGLIAATREKTMKKPSEKEEQFVSSADSFRSPVRGAIARV